MVHQRSCASYPEVEFKKETYERLKGWGVSLSVLRPYAAHGIKLVCMAVSPEASSKDDAQESP